MSDPTLSPESETTTPRAFRLRLITRPALKRLGVLFLILVLCGAWVWSSMIRMPGTSHRGPLPPLTDHEAALAVELRRDVTTLASEIGSRSLFNPRKLAAAADFLDTSLAHAGYAARRYTFTARGAPWPNIEAELRGTTHPSEIIVIGAHYDIYLGTPGANDNASGVAATLALARAFAAKPQPRTIRFLLFVNEEPPCFQTPDMGSWVYAKQCRAGGDTITAMLSLETIGYYSDEPGSQQYPAPLSAFYPTTGNFIGFVGNHASRNLVRQVVKSFRSHTRFPSEGAALPDLLPGVGWSDHWSFWQEGYPALMVTDTALFRYPHYHMPTDTPDKLDYERMARVVAGLERVLTELANP